MDKIQRKGVPLMSNIRFLDADGTFSLQRPENYSALYLPLAGEAGLKSAVTPNLGGDAKLDQETFLLEPATVETLHASRATRNFWCLLPGEGYWSATGASAEEEARRFTPEQDDSTLTAGFMWQTVRRASTKYRLEAEVTCFVPVNDNVEVLLVRLRNLADAPRKLVPVAAVPIYGRSADNVRDHRNVTSMLHRIRTVERGVLVKPTLSFDERGHRRNETIYYAAGATGAGEAPESFYPTVEGFLGEGGSFTHPAAVCRNLPGAPAGARIDGREAMGGLRFPEVTLRPGEAAECVVLLGVAKREEDVARVVERYGSSERARAALEATSDYWQRRVNVRYRTGDADFDRLMRWVSFQPMLRRIYGCSFLPHHDYGRGGRGWRDLWQDCLSLLLMDPDGVGAMIRANFGGVRVDGANATIIGGGRGEFIADRNGISRVWMDHAAWPLMTVELYVDQTGDAGILLERAPYFKDAQSMRGTAIDAGWNETCGLKQRTAGGEVYQGTILEHLLLEQLCAFYEVGAHNELRLRGADWNDALDMAEKNGESVAFSCAYAGNLKRLSRLLGLLRDRLGCAKVELMEEMQLLLADDRALFENIGRKRALLAKYLERCAHAVSGRTVSLCVDRLIENLERKAEWMMAHIRRAEWIEHEGAGWFNSYYDDHGRRVEGAFDGQVRMMLTGQVFAVMSGVATPEQVAMICESADRYLYREEIGGYRLNTDFHELKFDLGRMFGFAYGEKENGAVFSHMAVMYANALYRRGFAREGWKALRALYRAALNFDVSRIYPGIPEYFRADGRGVYHYLTGAASWFMLTMITEAFGVRGEAGDLAIAPKLLAEQFDADGRAALRLRFAGRDLEVCFHNPEGLDFGEYAIRSASLDGEALPLDARGGLLLPRQALEALGEGPHAIEIELSTK